ncbi:MAG: hypothetical protein FWC76_04585 [Defluviitaleaceae bacterium]|nr:hypothetical protein [Defluviitaleaceae bacterium]
MAQFPMGGFFNRHRQNIHHGGQFQRMPGYSMGSMQPNMPMQGQNPMFGPRFSNPNFHPQQNAPRAAFPPHFNPNFARSSQHSPHQGSMGQMRPPYPPANVPNAMPRGHMGQMPMPQQAGPPAQQMPPMHLLNPTNDPSVRFEPMPAGMVPPGGTEAPKQAPPQMPQQAAPNTSPDGNAGGIISRLSDYVQGESNSLVYYESLSKSPRISEDVRELVLELMNNKKQHVHNAAQMYRELAKSEWGAKDMKIADAKSFKADIAYALLQESRLLREASGIALNLDNAAHQKIMNSMLHNKIADIAHLMAL